MAKSIISVLGLCAIASCSAQQWTVVAPNVATIAAAIAAPNEKTVYLPCGQNGGTSLAEVLKSVDAGVNWHPCPGVTGLMLMGGAATESDICVSGMFSLQYSDTAGRNFSDSLQLGGSIAVSQSAAAGPGGLFGITGSALLAAGNGGVSTSNGGGIFTFSNATALTTLARYGAFPTATTWFVTAGTWPNQNDIQSIASSMGVPGLHVQPLTENFAYAVGEIENSDGSHERKVFSSLVPTWKLRGQMEGLKAAGLRGAPNNGTGGYRAQIVKTTDGGHTWTSVFSNSGVYYFNDIDCSNENNCCAVAESDGGPDPAARILCTNDGGVQWNETMTAPGADMSVMGITYSGVAGAKSATDVWAVGGQLSSTAFTGFFWHSTDGGQTWTADQVPGVYGSDVSFPAVGVGFASAFTQQDTSSVVAYGSSA